MRFLQEHVHELICKLIDNGYYVNFDGVDDYYLENKSWYQRRHFCHDGLIYGYDEAQKTYDVYAYDSNWSYRGFKICQDSFVKGRDVMMQQGTVVRAVMLPCSLVEPAIHANIATVTAEVLAVAASLSEEAARTSIWIARLFFRTSQ